MSSAGEDDDDDDDDQSSEVVPPPLKVASYAQALLYLEDVQAFLEHKGNTLEACEIMGFSNKITSLHCRSLVNGRQTSLREFITPCDQELNTTSTLIMNKSLSVYNMSLTFFLSVVAILQWAYGMQ